MESGKRQRGFALALMLAVACAIALLASVAPISPLAPRAAWALGGVVLEGTTFVTDDLESVPPDPDLSYYAAFQFSKNVAYARQGDDRAFIDENLAKCHLRDAQGNDVPGAYFFVGEAQAERQIIYLGLEDWLAPLSRYEVVIDKGIAAANGEDFSETPYVVSFKTSGDLPDGTTVFQIACIVVVAAAVGVGMVVQVVRRVRAK